MLSYALRTLLRMALTFFVIVTIVFFATRLSGNAVDFVIGEGMTSEDRELLIKYYELDRPVRSQYLAFLRSFTDGQFGLSFIERRPVAEIVVERIWPSTQLLLSAVGLTLLVSIPLGIAAAIWRKSWVGSAVMVVAFLGYAVPNFVLATLMVLIFSYWLNWLPVVGNGTAWHFIMPTIALSGVLIAALTRFTRNAMLDVLGQDFMRTARAKGLPENAVIVKHGLRNAGITILSVIGLQVAGLAASGSVVIEAIFAWPGIGDLLVTSALRRDYPVLQFGVLTVALAVIVINAAVDLAYAWADPRLRHTVKG
ncbi:ABC transporter permease [Phaeobacter gallaeciensis]|uniref:ABC transporter permease n=1 Tax=Phaeobacter gallaeciensis TaxID=60890 RepID=UPI00237F3625|nr:ABC transporter permease [Phaeobacter gallaeciensis]MDE4306424.1 ABC transporter permease [Phaeobacter gallaeciensis]MDE4310892.1 ABC transporter permease [Phaeobacter gallaeciensis]MDE4315344.1 ABC transporter permease [Phaeobacter gallaeciensis]MDE4319816.1 ABC transporter permease [Phaeobacter gallaeciensis]MDE4324283.1 ABC transporter permease [Phaeobacter gallaeciensis]